VRRGEDLGTIKSDVRSAVQRHLSERGLPVSKLNVNLVEADPRQTKTRVQ
jgi:benzoyl-CoA reductase/2-hydroxyglutaryl-CoA dehydratase subunit BcrC/BadD/HgdB